MRKKALTTIVSAVFACAMLITALVPVTAITGTDTADIYISQVSDGTEISAYRVISVNVNEDAGVPESPMYKWDAEVARWLKANGYASYVLTGNHVSDTFKEANAGELTPFWHKLAKAIKTESSYSFPVAEKATAIGEQVRITEASMGQYLLTAKGGDKVYAPTTATHVPAYNKATGKWTLSDTYINMKGEAPTIDKTVANTADKTVAIGDVITYKLTILAPSYPEDAVATSFLVSDKLPASLTYQKGTVKIYRDEQLTDQVIAGGNYTVDETATSSFTFRIDFSKSFINDASNAGQKFYITYNAKVTSATPVYENTATITYNNDPYDASSKKDITDTENVYSYTIEVQKVDRDKNPLTGAEFTLWSGEKQLRFSGLNGDYMYDPTGTVDTLQVSSDGSFHVTGLDIGTYELRETKAPDGFTIPTGAIKIVLVDTQPDGILDDTSKVTTTGTYQLDGDSTIDKHILNFGVINSAGFDLPVTGGSGTIAFTVFGLALMGGAAVMLLHSRKKAMKK